MIWHVLAPHTDGGHNSIDYSDSLADAVHLARHWRLEYGEDLALARGVNGEPLRYVVYYRVKGGKDIYVTAVRTKRGADRVMKRVGREHPEAVEYGWSLVGCL